MHARRISPTTTLVLGLAAAVGALGCWAASSTVTDRRTVLNEAYTIAKSEPVREEFAWKIADAIAPHSATSNPAALNLSNDVARKVVETTAFQQAFASALPAVYDQVIDGAQGDVTLDAGLVAQAFAEAGAPQPPNLTLAVTRDQVPDLRDSIKVMEDLTAVLAALAVLLIGIGLAIAPHRGRAIMRIGRWLITTGIVAIVMFWALPTLALLPLGGWIGVIGIVLATGDWLVVPASVLAAFGMTILVLGRAGEAEGRRRELAVIPTMKARTPTRTSIS